jgi:predicted glycosyltransferase
LAERGSRILFVPVSGPYGVGEFARCSAIASAALERWPQASVHFLLSRQAPYVARVPYPVTLLPSSATFHSAEVIELIRTWLPDVVIFDNAGRSAQLRSARRLGARVVFISSRRRQRRRAFRLSWMRLIDEHWIAYPRLIAGKLGLLERAKLRLLQRPVVRYLDVIMARAAQSSISAASAAACGSIRGEVVVIPGGGTGHPGAEDASRQFLTAARDLAAAGFATTFIGPSEDTGVSEGHGTQSLARLSCVAALPQADLVALMRGARLVIANGGSTLLQAIACGAPCVAAPIAGDQRERIRACAAAGVAVEAAPHAADLEAKARSLLDNEPARAALARRAAALELADGVEVALDALESLGQRS